MELEERRLRANGLTFAYLEAAPAGATEAEAARAPLALCLHGFPDSAWSWRHLLPELARAGYRAVAPFLRGYAPTAIPTPGRYQVGALVADAIAIREELGADADAVIIGHDWGAMAAYGAASYQPTLWRRVVAAAVPPIQLMAQGLFTYPQLKRSWYTFFFQSPLADAAVAVRGLAFLDRLWADWSPGYDASVDLAYVKDCLRDPANLAAALGYYRALYDPTRHAPEFAREQQAAYGASTVPQPTLYLHGADDGCVGAELVTGAEAYLGPGSKVAILPGAGHFVHLERPDEVNALILDFLSGSG